MTVRAYAGLAPYVGLTPFSAEDGRFFFGREREEEVLVANLVASRLPILYGGMGVGKSSLLRAGVVRRLRENANANAADLGVSKLAVVVFSNWSGGDPVGELGDAIRASAEEFRPDRRLNGPSAPSGSTRRSRHAPATSRAKS